MSEDLAAEPFDDAAEKVKAAHEQAVAALKSKVEKAKAAALKKVG